MDTSVEERIRNTLDGAREFSQKTLNIVFRLKRAFSSGGRSVMVNARVDASALSGIPDSQLDEHCKAQFAQQILSQLQTTPITMPISTIREEIERYLPQPTAFFVDALLPGIPGGLLYARTSAFAGISSGSLIKSNRTALEVTCYILSCNPNVTPLEGLKACTQIVAACVPIEGGCSWWGSWQKLPGAIPKGMRTVEECQESNIAFLQTLAPGGLAPDGLSVKVTIPERRGTGASPRGTAKNCGACGAELPSNAKFCNKCGARFS